METIPRSANHLLASLPMPDFELLRPHLRLVDLVHESVIATTGGPLSRVWFPLSGVISVVVRLLEGDMVETAMIGRDGVFGSSGFYNGGTSLNDAIIQIPGAASVIDLHHFRNAVAASPLLRDTLLRHEMFLLLQAQQSVACNAYHSVEARLSRWLLRAHDLHNENVLPLTQGFLAQMIGVRRNSVSLVANTLQQAGFVRYRRGHIEITGLEGLEETTCECYQMVKTRVGELIHRDMNHGLGRGQTSDANAEVATGQRH